MDKQPEVVKSLTKAEKLDKLCVELVNDPKLEPEYKDGKFVKSFCNIAVDRAAQFYGYKDFTGSDGKPFLANKIIAIIEEETGDWKKVGHEEAWGHANDGALVIACVRGNPHGHIAVVAPRKKVWSQKWTNYCPQVANVGGNENDPQHKNAIKGENFSFLAERPTHYVYLP